MALPHCINEIDTPALLFETKIIQDNILRMQEYARRHGVALRPHVKAHKCGLLARMQIDAGAVGISVAKLSEAEKMASLGFTNIQIANQVVGQIKVDRLLNLAEKVTVTVAVDSKPSLFELSRAFYARQMNLGLFIEIDVGLKRAGLSRTEEIIDLAGLIHENRGVELEGILSHAGHAYSATNRSELTMIAEEEGYFMVDLADRLQAGGCEIRQVSVGSTPTIRYSGKIKGITEIRPGNYIFNDMMQVSMGTCVQSQCALTVLASVTSIKPDQRAVIDAGSKALSLEQGVHGNQLLSGYGYIPGLDSKVVRVSEEHGIITHNIDTLKLTQKVRIIPNHACPVANLFDKAYLVDGDEVIDQIRIDARGCMT